MSDHSPYRSSLRVLVSLAGVFFVHSAQSSAIGDDARKELGQALYLEHCESCHGAKGEGVADIYAQPLTGDRSIRELSQYLHTSMPDGSPEDVVDDDAASVAEYIYDAFYSPVAQVRNAPPQLLFSRLTARQMQYSIVDAINDRHLLEWMRDNRGAEAKYYNAKSRKNDRKVGELVVPTIDFKFPDDVVDPEKHDDESIAASWWAGLIAPKTGHYTFRVESNGAFWLAVNSDDDKALIDRVVKSGDETEFEATTYLVEGRVYPIRMELKKVKKEDAFFRLKWTPPGGVSELIPQHVMMPGWFNNVPVVTTAFPADDASTGYARGDAVSQEWAQAAARAAIEASQIISADPFHFAGINSRKDNAEARVEKARDYALRLARIAYRRPLTEDEEQSINSEFEEGPFEAALQRVALRTFASPNFLYREVKRGEFDDHAAAAWISYALWDSVPDKHLRAAADKGALNSRGHFQSQVSSGINKVRARAKLKDFFTHWLHVDRFHEMAKNAERYPQFDARVISDLHASLDLFIDDIVWGDNPDFRRLLRSRELYLNKNLADLYAGGEWDSEVDADQFVKVALDGEPRAGILSHPYLMAGFAHDKTTSPIHRGVFMSRNVLGRMLKIPTAAISPLSPDLQPEMTTRERIHLQTDSTACMSCHSLINPLGFAFENFDAIGQFRETENNKPVDSSGVYITSEGHEVEFENLADLADWMAESDEARAAFVSHLFHYTIKQPIYAFGGIEYRNELVKRFKESGHNIRQLWVDIIVTSAERMRKMSLGESVAKK